MGALDSNQTQSGSKIDESKIDSSTMKTYGGTFAQPAIVKCTTKKRAVVFPWNLVPDWAIAALTFALLVPYLPIFVSVISAGLGIQGGLRLLDRGCGGALAQLYYRGCEVAEWIGSYFVRDRKDAPKVVPTFFLMFWIPGMFFYAAYRHQTLGFEWWLVPLYHLMRIGPRFRFFAYLYVLIHQEGHSEEGFFRAPFTFLNRINQCWTALFFGQIPYIFQIGHNKCHHRHDNMLDDVCTNLDLDRSQPWSFIMYFPRFAAYWTGLGLVPYFWARGQKDRGNLLGILLGMLVFWSLSALVFYTMGPVFFFMYWLFPHFEGIIFFGGISYLWHAFCEPEDPYNKYVNSMTVLDGHDNIWNEDYHVEHHHNVQLHPADYAPHYYKNMEKFRKNQATIFRDCEEGTLLHWLLSENFDELANHFVDLDGKMTQEEKKAIIMRRLSSRFNRPGDEEIQLKKEAAAEAKMKKE